jgi:molybdenum cofactor cytidylyltransferase
MKLIVLAAGCSQRMGQPKQLLKWQGKTMLQHCLDKLESCEVEIILVLGANADAIKSSLNTQCCILENPHWSAGMGTSIALGMENINLDDPAVMIMLADQPAITAAEINNLIQNWSEVPEKICCSYFEQHNNANQLQQVLSVPAIFPQQYFAELSNLSANTGAKSILMREVENLNQIAMPNTQININTADDWRHWLKKITKQQDIQEDTNNEIYAE